MKPLYFSVPDKCVLIANEAFRSSVALGSREFIVVFTTAGGEGAA
jgi:hypothetical protein